MRKATLKTYTKNKLVEYYQKPLYFSHLLADSSNDQRLAEAAQSYYLARLEFEKANAFSFKTKETYSTYEDFVNSNQKYAWQFRELNDSMLKFREKASAKLLHALRESNKSTYWLAKNVNTCQSNLNQFLKMKNLNAVSDDKVFKMYKLLNVKFD